MNKQTFLKGFEFLSTVGFLIGYFNYNLQIATAVLMVMLTMLVVMTLALKEPLGKLQLWSWIIVVLFGGATVLLQDDLYIKWKPTIINSGIGLVFLLSHVIGKLTIFERLVANHLKAPRDKLRRVNGVISGYLFFVAVLNIYVAYNFSNTFWVNFKIIGLFCFNLALFAWGYYYLKEHVRAYLLEMQEKNK